MSRDFEQSGSRPYVAFDLYETQQGGPSNLAGLAAVPCCCVRAMLVVDGLLAEGS